MQAEAGKGSKRRQNDDHKAYAEGWDMIFKHSKEQKQEPKSKQEQK